MRAVQKLFCQADASTTIIYTDVLNRGGRGVRSPLDSLPRLGRGPRIPAEEERIPKVANNRDDYGSPFLKTESVLVQPAQMIRRARLTRIKSSVLTLGELQ